MRRSAPRIPINKGTTRAKANDSYNGKKRNKLKQAKANTKKALGNPSSKKFKIKRLPKKNLSKEVRIKFAFENLTNILELLDTKKDAQLIDFLNKARYTLLVDSSSLPNIEKIISHFA